MRAKTCQAGRCVHGERKKPLEVKDCVGRCSVSHKGWESYVEAASLSESSLSCSPSDCVFYRRKPAACVLVITLPHLPCAHLGGALGLPSCADIMDCLVRPLLTKSSPKADTLPFAGVALIPGQVISHKVGKIFATYMNMVVWQSESPSRRLREGEWMKFFSLPQFY